MSEENKNMKKHPIQPLIKDKDGVLRFRPNKIVEYLLDNCGIDLNEIARMDFENDEREQFAQLIGYSLSGFGGLSYTSDETYSAARIMDEESISETEARLFFNENLVDKTRAALRELVPHLFRVAPEDLVE